MWFFLKTWYGADFKVEVEYLTDMNSTTRNVANSSTP